VFSSVPPEKHLDDVRHTYAAGRHGQVQAGSFLGSKPFHQSGVVSSHPPAGNAKVLRNPQGAPQTQTVGLTYAATYPQAEFGLITIRAHLRGTRSWISTLLGKVAYS
jgi:hypothetical protein